VRAREKDVAFATLAELDRAEALAKADGSRMSGRYTD
jgi:hypothetical protein